MSQSKHQTTRNILRFSALVLLLLSIGSSALAYEQVIVNPSAVPNREADQFTPGDKIYVSMQNNNSVNGVDYNDEDILLFDTNTNSWSLYMDGSDVGLTSGAYDPGSFHIMPDDSIIFNPVNEANFSGIGLVDDSDLVRFIPTSLGENTAGTFELYFDGSDVGLTSNSQEILALHILSNGHILMDGPVNTGGLSGTRGEDIIEFIPTSLGENTAGTFQLYFDGSDVGLDASDNEGIWGLWVDESNGDIYINTKSSYSVPGVSGGQESILKCTPTSLGENTACTFEEYWDGAPYGMTHRLDNLFIELSTAVPANNAPTAVDDAASMSLGTVITVAVLANDTDADGDSLTVTNAVSNNSSVTAVINPDNTINISAPSDMDPGHVIITYTIDDGNGGTDSADVTVTVGDVAPPTPTFTPTPTITATPSSLSVTSFTLINADTDEDLAVLSDGDTLNLATLPTTNLSVRANVSGDVGSVQFELDGDASFSVESAPPYALVGDTDGDYNPWTPTLGTHLLRAVPYSEAGGTGSEGTALQVSFTVIDDTAPTSTPIPPTATPTGNGRVTDGLQALYTFSEGSGSVVNDVSGVSPALNLTISDTNRVSWLAEGGLTIDSPTLIESDDAATKLIDAAQASEEMTFEAWITPANLTQAGPARIMTLSASGSLRNMTFGQDGDFLNGRVRSTDTSNNGVPTLDSPVGSLTSGMHHLVFTRSSDGTRTIYVDGVAVVTDTSVAGSLSNWDDSYHFALANEFAQTDITARDWLGTYHLAAVYGKALSPAEISQNFAAGFGEALSLIEVSPNDYLNINGTNNGETVVEQFEIRNIHHQTITWSATSSSVTLTPSQNLAGLPANASQFVTVSTSCTDSNNYTYPISIVGETSTGSQLISYDVILNCDDTGENSHYLNDMAHTGYDVSENNLQVPLTLTNEFLAPNGYYAGASAPTITDNYIILSFINNDNSAVLLQALDKQTDALVWETNILGRTESPGSTPLVNENVIYLTTRETGPSGAVFTVSAISVSTGDVLWTRPYNTDAPDMPVIDSNRLFLLQSASGTNNVSVLALNKRTGAIIWEETYNTDANYYGLGNPILVNDTIAFFTENGEIFGLDKTTGIVKWSVNNIDLTTFNWDLVGDERNDQIYASVDLPFGAGLQAFNAETGQSVWLYDGYSCCPSVNPILANDTIYHLSGVGADNYLFVLNAISGTVESQIQIPYLDYLFAFATLANDTIYVSTEAATNPLLTAYNAQTGEQLWESAALGANIVPIVTSDGKLYVSNSTDIQVYEPFTTTLAANFEAWPHVGTAPLSVEFVNYSIGATNYQWDFGDGTTSTEITPTHVYTTPGVYTVTLTAVNDLGTTNTLIRESFISVDYAEIPSLQILPEKSVIFESPGQTYQFYAEMIYPEGWNGPVVNIDPSSIQWSSSDNSQVQVTSSGLATVMTADAYALIIASLNFDPGFPYDVGIGSMMVADVHDDVFQLDGTLVTNQLIIEEEEEHKIILEVTSTPETTILNVGDTVLFGDVATIIIEEKMPAGNSSIVLSGRIPGLTDIFNQLSAEISSEQVKNVIALQAQANPKLLSKMVRSTNVAATSAPGLGRVASDQDCAIEIIYNFEPDTDFKVNVMGGVVRELEFTAQMVFALTALGQPLVPVNVECAIEWDFPPLAIFSAPFGALNVQPNISLTLGGEFSKQVAENAIVETPNLSVTKPFTSSFIYNDVDGYSFPSDYGETQKTIELNLVSFDDNGSVIEVDGSLYVQVALDWKINVGFVTIAEAKLPAARLTAGRHFVLPTPLDRRSPIYQGPLVYDYARLDVWPLKEISSPEWWEKLGIPPITLEYNSLKVNIFDERAYFPRNYAPGVSEETVYINGDSNRGFPPSTSITTERTPWTNPFLPNPAIRTEIWSRNVAEATDFSLFYDGDGVDWTPEPAQSGTYEFRAFTYYDTPDTAGIYWSQFPNASPIESVTVRTYVDLMVESTPVKMDVPVYDSDAKAVAVTNNSTIPISFNLTDLPSNLSIAPSGMVTIQPGEVEHIIFEYACYGLSSETGTLGFNTTPTVTWEPITYEFNCVNFRITPPEARLYGNANEGQAVGRFVIHNISDQILTWSASYDTIELEPAQNLSGLAPGDTEFVTVRAKCPSFGIHNYQISIDGTLGTGVDTQLYDVVLDCRSFGENGMYLNDIGHTGYAPLEKSLTPPLVQSNYLAPPVGYVHHDLVAPMVTENYYIVAYNTNDTNPESEVMLQAYHKATDALAWQTPGITGTIRVSPVASDDIIYLITDELIDGLYVYRTLHALSAASGQTIWEQPYVSGADSQVPIVDDNRVYILRYDLVTESILMSAYDKGSGSLVWENGYYTEEPNISWGNPVIVNDTIAFAVSPSEIQAFYKATGLPKWTITNIDLITWNGDLVGDEKNNQIYASVDLPYGAGLQAFDVETGESTWFYDELYCCTSANPVLANDKLYFLGGMAADNHLFTFDAISGTLESQYQIPYMDYGFAFMTLANDTIYASTSYYSGYSIVTAFSAETGALLWEAPTEDYNTAPIVVSDGRLYIGNASGVFIYESAYTISGNVLDDSSPVQGVTVEIIDDEGNVVSVVTDADGYFEANDLVSGDYTVTPLPANNSYGFVPESLTVAVPPDTTDLTFDLYISEPPVAQDDDVEVYMNSDSDLYVLVNDTDPNGDALEITQVNQPSFGTAVIVGGNRIAYTPEQNYIGTDSLTYTVSDNKGGDSTATVNITVLNDPAGGLPVPWQNGDIGSVNLPGSTIFTANQFEVEGNGVADDDNNLSGFHYLYQPLSGDGSITARLSDQSYTDFSGKAGLMIRDDLSPDSPYVFVAFSPAGFATLSGRTEAGGDTYETSQIRLMSRSWIRLVRQGSAIIVYFSSNGVDWNYSVQLLQSFPTDSYIGLAVTSNNASENASVTFDKVYVR